MALTMRAATIGVLLVVGAEAQAAAQIGGRPPKAVVTDLCSISAVFARLSQIKANPACRAGCHGGKCPKDWYPGKEDKCSAACGKVFEPFWDQCGAMLIGAKMGGVDGMERFYQHCLAELYPPGSCGTFCNGHTYNCYLKEVHSACCDEHERNCVRGQDVPKTCPVGCALVFPEFIETCSDHIKAEKGLNYADFSSFEKKCLNMDALSLVEYALDLKARGCFLDLSGGRRRLQTGVFLGRSFGSNDPHCNWDQIDNFANDVDKICCAGGTCGRGRPPTKCSAACAVAMHQFSRDCQATLKMVMPSTDSRRVSIENFGKKCMSGIDSKFFIKAIMKAKCPAGVAGPGHQVRAPHPSSDTIYFEDFESGLSGWRGKNGTPKPYSAVLAIDPDPSHKHVLNMQKCTGGGDAYSAALINCELSKPCVVEFDFKGPAWQGFSNGFPGSHTWSATHHKYTGQHVNLHTDHQHWQHAEYIFPVKEKSGTTHIHGSHVAVKNEHFMVEAFNAGSNCNKAMIDNILISRASPARLCDQVDKRSYYKLCQETEWHKSIDMSDYIALPTCTVLVNTNGATCAQYCKSQGQVCRHAQDNVGNSCKLDKSHTRQTTANNGCNQKWQNQVCGCGSPAIKH